MEFKYTQIHFSLNKNIFNNFYMSH